MAKLAYSVVHLYHVSATVEQGQDVEMMLVEYECIIGRKKDVSSSSGLLLDEDATGTVGRKPDKFLISV